MGAKLVSLCHYVVPGDRRGVSALTSVRAIMYGVCVGRGVGDVFRAGDVLAMKFWSRAKPGERLTFRVMESAIDTGAFRFRFVHVLRPSSIVPRPLPGIVASREFSGVYSNLLSRTAQVRSGLL